MSAHLASNESVDKLLNKIVEEVEKEIRPIQYASFIQRVISRLIDTAIIVGISYAIQLAAFHYIKKDNVFNADYIMDGLSQAMPALAIMLWVLLYSPIMESTGGTLGKRIMRIQLVDEETHLVSPFRNYVIRSWIYLIFIVLAVLPSILSCLAYFVSDRKQTWHDKMASVICVKKKSN